MDVRVIVVDTFKEERPISAMYLHRAALLGNTIPLMHAEPKPTIWQGKHRITSENWWAKSNALNTGICLCQTDFIAFCDDRCVLGPLWLSAVYDSMNGNYAVCGRYEKHYDMKVEHGIITDPGFTAGIDTRREHGHAVPFNDWYGGSCALPLEWCLKVGGYSEDLCDSLGAEDSMFGTVLKNNGYPIRYDSRMLIIEDRTPTDIDGALRRADKGVSPNDKSHKIVEILRDKTDSQNSFDIRNIRDRILNGETFPPPSASHYDWFDGAKIE